MKPTKTQLAFQTLCQRQSLPLKAKVRMTLRRIQEWYDHWEGMVYIAFSGGKDSTVLLHLVRTLYPGIPAVFCDTGLEYPEIRKFVKTVENTTWLKPKMGFKKVLEKYGYPIISKEQAKYISEVQQGTTKYTENKRLGKVLGRNGKPVGMVSKKWQFLMYQTKVRVSERCCDIMKKRPFLQYEKLTGRYPILGVKVEDSQLRQLSSQLYGCNAFTMTRPQSRPMMFWQEVDVWAYIQQEKLAYSSIYDMGYSRTGCMFCMFGVHLETQPNRFQNMAITHPKQYKFCMEKLGLARILKYIHVPYKPIKPKARFF